MSIEHRGTGPNYINLKGAAAGGVLLSLTVALGGCANTLDDARTTPAAASPLASPSLSPAATEAPATSELSASPTGQSEPLQTVVPSPKPRLPLPTTTPDYTLPDPLRPDQIRLPKWPDGRLVWREPVAFKCVSPRFLQVTSLVRPYIEPDIPHHRLLHKPVSTAKHIKPKPGPKPIVPRPLPQPHIESKNYTGMLIRRICRDEKVSAQEEVLARKIVAMSWLPQRDLIRIPTTLSDQ